MPITQIDPAAALVVIDLQKGHANVPFVHPWPQIVYRSACLVQAFRRRGLAVVLVAVAGRAPGRTEVRRPEHPLPADFAELLPELGSQPGDLLITKHSPGAFLGTALHEELHRRGVTQVIFTGVTTSNGVEASARSAHDLGYNLVFVSDAMTDPSREAHEYNLQRVFPRIGEIGTSEELLALLGA